MSKCILIDILNKLVAYVQNQEDGCISCRQWAYIFACKTTIL